MSIIIAAMASGSMALRAVAEEEEAWNPALNPAVAELLDIVAEELALEYVRMMEAAAERDQHADKVAVLTREG